MPASQRFVDPCRSNLRSAHPTAPTATEPVAASQAPCQQVDEPLAAEAELVGVLLEPLAPGETHSTGFARKERLMLARLETLSAAEAVRLHDRLTVARCGDALATAFTRLSVERRARLLSFLREAPTRDLLRKARRVR